MAEAARKRRSREERLAELCADLDSVQNGVSMANYVAIFDQCEELGIPDDEVYPRVNVLKFRLWETQGRRVMAGSRGIQGQTWVRTKEVDEKGRRKMRPKTVYMFHIAQTRPEELELPYQPRTRRKAGARVLTPQGPGEVVSYFTGPAPDYARLVRAVVELADGRTLETTPEELEPLPE